MRFLLPLFLSLTLALPAGALENRLAGHPSPYLAMHGQDPVAWQDWDPKLIEQAQRENKLLFISSGYFSCYWCHVMQKESYSNPEIAAFLNEHFIPVKVDRELHPALDAYLIDYTERTTGRAGWPLNVFLTPQGYPLLGMSYLPPKQFAQVIARLARAWQGDASRLRQLARQALLELTADPVGELPEPVSIDTLRTRFLHQVLALADPLEGGFGEQNKFPMTPQLEAVLRLLHDRRHERLDAWLQLTLDQMMNQGLRDHLAGGFYRYTVDPSWQVPHFEKMLYTQALLARVYLLAAERFARQDYAEVAAETLDFVRERMRGPHGLFIASFSATDEAGEEGGSYLWHEDELKRLLKGRDLELVQRHWAMHGAPSVDGGWLPRKGETIEALAKDMQQTPAELKQRLERIRQRLLAARDRRELPADTKEVAGWNGLMIGSLAMAGAQLQRDDFVEAALDLARRLRERLWRDGALWRARDGERAVGTAGLSDYAYVADGLERLLAVRPDAELAAWHTALLAQSWQRFHTVRGWRLAERPDLPGMGESPVIQDGALPAAAAVVLASGLRRDEPRAREAAAEAWPRIQDEPFWYASWVEALVVAADSDKPVSGEQPLVQQAAGGEGKATGDQ